MGPFPHDAPAPQIDATNPAGTDGFEFVALEVFNVPGAI